METGNKNLTDKIVAGIKSLAGELDHLKVQMALGKAEAKDLFEELKDDFRSGIRETQESLSQLKKDEKIRKFINAFEHLQVQLALGKAETAEMFAEQASKLRAAVNELENQISSNPGLKNIIGEMHFEFDKFRIRMELMELHFKLHKIKAEYKFEEKKAEFMADIEKLKARLQQKEEQAKDKLASFRNEMNSALTHLRKAFQ